MTIRFNQALTEAVEAGNLAHGSLQVEAGFAQITSWTEELSVLEKRIATLRQVEQIPAAGELIQDELAALAIERERLNKKISTAKAAAQIRIIRDVYGKLRFAINVNAKDYPAPLKQELETAIAGLGKFAATGSILFRDGLANPDAIFDKNPEWHDTAIPLNYEDGIPGTYWTAKVLDRQVMGQDWLNEDEPEDGNRPHRIVFYGLKGGVGRSTALAMTALALAKAGKRVLLLDFDLESPGLSSLLLPPKKVDTFGLVDWFVEDAVDQADSELLGKLLVSSPLFAQENATEYDEKGIEVTKPKAGIWLAPAMGRNETAYLTKLARVYADVPAKKTGGEMQTFSKRMRTLVRILEKRAQADVVLIDSRAGFHDVAAIAITTLADTALLFATDSPQNWDGYRQLFAHWQQRPAVCKRVRTKLAMVQALSPQGNKDKRIASFRQHAYEVFAENLYDRPPSTPNDENLPATFLPQMDDQFAPHFPIRIDWNALFQEYVPLLREEEGGVSDLQIAATFGGLQKWVLERVNDKDE